MGKETGLLSKCSFTAKNKAIKAITTINLLKKAEIKYIIEICSEKKQKNLRYTPKMNLPPFNTIFVQSLNN